MPDPASNMGNPLCEVLPWDSQFFARRIGRVNRHRLDETTMTAVLRWCALEQIDCLYFLADSDDAPTVRLAEANGFAQTDVRMTFGRRTSEADGVPPQPHAVALRHAQPQDLPALRSIAKTSHHDTRFYYDGCFDPAQCDALYETWIENSLGGFAQAVFVAEIEGQVSGYITCHLRGAAETKEAQIGLVAVSEAQQGQGVGGLLVQQFCAWATQQGAAHTTVVTQGRNIRAQRLYQRLGFLTTSLQLWYHLWFL